MTAYNKMIEFLSAMMRGPSPEEVARRELRQAQLELLRSQSACEYASAVIEYNRARVERLKSMLEAVK